MAKIGFIGMGNMATAIMKGLLKEFSPEDMIFSSAHEEKMEKITRETGFPMWAPTQSAPDRQSTWSWL